jgi:hypothetical protein
MERAVTRRLSASVYREGEFPVMGYDGEILRWWIFLKERLVWLVHEELWRKEFGFCDLVGFFGVDKGEYFHGQHRQPFLWSILDFVLFCFNDFLDWRINFVLQLTWFAMKRSRLVGISWNFAFYGIFLSWR